MVTSNFPATKSFSFPKNAVVKLVTADTGGKLITLAAGPLMPPLSAFNTAYMKPRSHDPL